MVLFSDKGFFAVASGSGEDMMAEGLGSSSLSKMRAESLLVESEKIWDEKMLPKESVIT